MMNNPSENEKQLNENVVPPEHDSESEDLTVQMAALNVRRRSSAHRSHSIAGSYPHEAVYNQGGGDRPIVLRNRRIRNQDRQSLLFVTYPRASEQPFPMASVQVMECRLPSPHTVMLPSYHVFRAVAPQLPMAVAPPVPMAFTPQLPMVVTPQLPMAIAPQLPMPVAPQLPIPVAAQLPIPFPTYVTGYTTAPIPSPSTSFVPGFDCMVPNGFYLHHALHPDQSNGQVNVITRRSYAGRARPSFNHQPGPKLPQNSDHGSSGNEGCDDNDDDHSSDEEFFDSTDNMNNH